MRMQLISSRLKYYTCSVYELKQLLAFCVAVVGAVLKIAVG